MCLLWICHFICIYVCHDVVDSWGAHVPLNALKSKEACGSRIGSGKNLDIPKGLDFFPLAVRSDSSKPCVVCPVVTWFCNSWFPWDFLNANHLGGLSRLILSCSLAACPALSWFKDLTERSWAVNWLWWVFFGCWRWAHLWEQKRESAPFLKCKMVSFKTTVRMAWGWTDEAWFWNLCQLVDSLRLLEVGM